MPEVPLPAAPAPDPEGEIAEGGAGAVVGLVAVVCLGFVLLSGAITDVQGGGVSSVGAGVSAERGEAIFWGTGPVDGTCATCHSVGERGAMQRGPNLGAGPQGEDIYARAVQRAAERAAETGEPMSAEDYLVESIADPSAYVAEGFPDRLMPLVYTGQIDLEPDDVLSVLAYLQSLGGELDLPALSAALSRSGRAILDKAAAGATTRAPSLALPLPIWEVLEEDQIGAWATLMEPAERAAFLDSELDEEQREGLGSL